MEIQQTPTSYEGESGEMVQLHLHQARNANLLHKAEQAASGFNMWLALTITNAVGSMPCAYLFMLLALIGFPGLHATPNQYVQYISQTVIQLVMLSILAVQQRIGGRHQELMAQEQYDTTVKTEHDAEIIAGVLTELRTDLRDLSGTVQQLVVAQQPVSRRTRAGKEVVG